MKTGYDQYFKKVKQSTKNAGAEVNRTQFDRRQKRKKMQFPVMPLLSFFMIAGGGLLALENFEYIETLFKKIDIGVETAQAVEGPKPAEAVAPVGGIDQKTLPVEAKKADDADYLFKLAERKKQLDQREEELNKLAALIEKQKAEVAANLARLEEVRGKISAALEEKIRSDETKVETLVQMYSNMKPQQAAKVFETLDEDLVIEILGRMKKKNAADILNLVKPEKAQILAERYAGYRAPAGQ